MKTLLGILLTLCLLYCVHSYADTTTINNKGMPVPSAMAPSMSGFSNDMCKSGVSGGANTGMFSISGGATITDENCERIKLAKTLNDLGLKVAAVSVSDSAPISLASAAVAVVVVAVVVPVRSKDCRYFVLDLGTPIPNAVVACVGGHMDGLPRSAQYHQ